MSITAVSPGSMVFVPARHVIKYADFRHGTDSNGDFWFIAKDWCDYLEIENASQAYTRIPESDKAEVSTVDPSSGQQRKMIALNEPGLYRLIFESRKPAAEDLKNWVFRELLPALRKYGYYRLSDDQRSLLPVSAGISENPTRFGRQPFLDVIKQRGVSIAKAKELMNALKIHDIPLINTTYHGQVYGKQFIQPALAQRAMTWLNAELTELFTPAALTKLQCNAKMVEAGRESPQYRIGDGPRWNASS